MRVSYFEKEKLKIGTEHMIK